MWSKCRIPRVMIDGLMELTVKRLNMFPAKSGISSEFSPSIIMNEPRLDYEKHLKYAFGEYVQAHLYNNRLNNNVEHTVDAIYLYPAQATTGGYVVMNLNTGKKTSRKMVTVIPVTSSVINKVEELAKKQGIKEIKFYNKKSKLNLP